MYIENHVQKYNMYAYGIDIGGTSIKIGLFKDYDLVTYGTIKTRISNKGEFILSDIYKYIEGINTKYKLSFSQIYGYGFGVPGPVINKVANGCCNIGWDSIIIEEEFRKLIPGANVTVTNDANAAALGEHWIGAGKGNKNLIMMTLGTGVGGAIIINNQLLVGKNGSAGQFGHAYVDTENPILCSCGNKGCLETLVSATGILRLARLELKKKNRDTVLSDYSRLETKHIFDSGKIGDNYSDEIINKVAKTTAHYLSIIACTIDPDVIILGGGVSESGNYFLDKIKKYYAEYSYFPQKSTSIRLAQLGNKAGIYGCAYTIFENNL